MVGSRFRWLLALLAVVALIAGACGQKSDDDGDDEVGGGATETAAPQEDDAGGGSGETAAVTITAKNFAFEPTQVDVPAGAEVEVTFVNKDDTAHTFTALDFGVDVRAEGGETVTATGTAPDSGFTTFHCSIHSSMMGTITVDGGNAAGGSGSSGGVGKGDYTDGGGSQDAEDSDSGYGY
jgi:cytochrome c oxidase subunit 2